MDNLSETEMLEELKRLVAEIPSGFVTAKFHMRDLLSDVLDNNIDELREAMATIETETLAMEFYMALPYSRFFDCATLGEAIAIINSVDVGAIAEECELGRWIAEIKKQISEG